MTIPSIAFVIPFYGSTEYLGLTLNSLRRQTTEDWHAVVVDDCSPNPGARELVESLSDKRIEYHRNISNLGLSGNWNHSITLARAPLVTLLHADDELLPEYASAMIEAHTQWPRASAIFCGATVMDADGKSIFSFRDYVKKWLVPTATEPYRLAGEDGVATLLRGNFIMCPTLCYKRPLFNTLTFSNNWRMVLDLDFYLRALMEGKEFVGLPNIAYRYRRHDGQVTAECERNLKLFTEEIDLWKQFAIAFRDRGWQVASKVASDMRIVKLQLGYYVLADFSRLQFRQAVDKLSLLKKILLP